MFIIIYTDPFQVSSGKLRRHQESGDVIREAGTSSGKRQSHERSGEVIREAATLSW